MWQDSVRCAADILASGEGVLRFCKKEGLAYKECRERHNLGKLSRRSLELSAGSYDQWRSEGSYSPNETGSDTSSGGASSTTGRDRSIISFSSSSSSSIGGDFHSSTATEASEAVCFEEIEQISRCSWNYASGYLIELAAKHIEVQRNCNFYVDQFTRCNETKATPCTDETLQLIQCSAEWFTYNHHKLGRNSY
ncbi:unnamed protein product [Amoebophrya sp. A25]|nr:unnamed protein product [Amoebophrya sp. A25]|eukprot:GSA25T00017607001.1